MENLIDLDINFDKYITSENFLGEGGEAIVYAIDENFVIRLVNTDNVAKQKFKYVKDIFDKDKNFGQPIAISEKGNITINKRVKGEPLYSNIKYQSETIEDEIIQINKYLETLEKYSNLDDFTLKNFIKDAIYLLSKGFIIDPCNPTNYLYDSENKKINILDLFKNKGNDKLTHGWFVRPLCFEKYLIKSYKIMSFEQRIKAFKLINKINKIFIKMCSMHNINKSTTQGIRMKNKINFYNILLIIDDIDYACDDLNKQIYQHLYPEIYKELYLKS